MFLLVFVVFFFLEVPIAEIGIGVKGSSEWAEERFLLSSP